MQETQPEPETTGTDRAELEPAEAEPEAVGADWAMIEAAGTNKAESEVREECWARLVAEKAMVTEESAGAM